MSDQSQEVPRRKAIADRESSIRQRIWKLWLVFFAAGLAAAFATSMSHAGQAEDQQNSRAVIEAQLEAFKQGDATKAFSYATPTIQRFFGNAENFMEMVRSGYDVVLKPASVRFVKFQSDGSSALHAVQMIDRQKVLWNVYYELQKRPDGSWRIASCEIEKAETNLI
jgi:hypothetical protein